jgi:hypothetical protein
VSMLGEIDMIGMFETQSLIHRCTRRRPGRLFGRSEP